LVDVTDLNVKERAQQVQEGDLGLEPAGGTQDRFQRIAARLVNGGHGLGNQAPQAALGKAALMVAQRLDRAAVCATAAAGAQVVEKPVGAKATLASVRVEEQDAVGRVQVDAPQGIGLGGGAGRISAPKPGADPAGVRQGVFLRVPATPGPVVPVGQQ